MQRPPGINVSQANFSRVLSSRATPEFDDADTIPLMIFTYQSIGCTLSSNHSSSSDSPSTFTKEGSLTIFPTRKSLRQDGAGRSSALWRRLRTLLVTALPSFLSYCSVGDIRNQILDSTLLDVSRLGLLKEGGGRRSTPSPYQLSLASSE